VGACSPFGVQRVPALCGDRDVHRERNWDHVENSQQDVTMFHLPHLAMYIPSPRGAINQQLCVLDGVVQVA
jgi:hypothetical protein